MRKFDLINFKINKHFRENLQKKVKRESKLKLLKFEIKFNEICKNKTTNKKHFDKSSSVDQYKENSSLRKSTYDFRFLNFRNSS